jgi:hypothetical protein
LTAPLCTSGRSRRSPLQAEEIDRVVAARGIDDEPAVGGPVGLRIVPGPLVTWRVSPEPKRWIKSDPCIPLGPESRPSGDDRPTQAAGRRGRYISR